jgi:hypothetical protein
MTLRMMTAVLLSAGCCDGGGAPMLNSMFDKQDSSAAPERCGSKTDSPHAMTSMMDASHIRLEAQIKDDKELRVEIERLKQRVKDSPFKSAERTLAFRALQQAKHWLGEDLQMLGTDYPYPNSMNPANPIVDPPADMPKP